MHYAIDYSKITDIAKRDAKALADTAGWLGQARFDELTTIFKEEPPIVFAKFQLMLTFVGVQGYPALAWFKHIYPDAPCLTCEHDWQLMEEDRNEEGQLKSISMLGTHQCSKCGDYNTLAADGSEPQH